MIGIIVVVLLTLFFLFVAFMASKSWRVTHVLLLVGIFLFALIFTGLSGMALKTRAGWKKEHQDLTSQLETLESELDRLEKGAPLAAAEQVESLPALRGELGRLLMDRGRVWRGVRPAGVAENAVLLNMARWGNEPCLRVGAEEDFDQPLVPEPDPAAEEPPAEDGEAAPGQHPHGIETGMVVYGFLERGVTPAEEIRRQALFGESDLVEADQRGFCRVPIYYLGDFRVVAVEGDAVTVQPILPPGETQIQAIQSQQDTWVLYEIMPIDSHDAMTGLSPEQIRSLFPQPPGLDQEAAYGQMVEQYVRDLQPAEPGDPPSRTMTKVKFLRDYEIDVDDEAEETGVAKSFNPSGEAILAQLRQGESTQFRAGDTDSLDPPVFDSETANRLRRDGIVEFADELPIYVRPLRDYAYYFQEKNDQTQRLMRQMEVLKTDNASVANSSAKAREQIDYREKEIGKLNQDRGQMDAELDVLNQFLSDLNRQLGEQRDALSHLYRWNLQLADELRRNTVYGARHENQPLGRR